MNNDNSNQEESPALTAGTGESQRGELIDHDIIEKIESWLLHMLVVHQGRRCPTGMAQVRQALLDQEFDITPLREGERTGGMMATVIRFLSEELDCVQAIELIREDLNDTQITMVTVYLPRHGGRMEANICDWDGVEEEGIPYYADVSFTVFAPDGGEGEIPVTMSVESFMHNATCLACNCGIDNPDNVCPHCHDPRQLRGLTSVTLHMADTWRRRGFTKSEVVSTLWPHEPSDETFMEREGE